MTSTLHSLNQKICYLFCPSIVVHIHVVVNVAHVCPSNCVAVGCKKKMITRICRHSSLATSASIVPFNATWSYCFICGAEILGLPWNLLDIKPKDFLFAYFKSSGFVPFGMPNMSKMSFGVNDRIFLF